MSRSKRKTPRIGNCSTQGQHVFKKVESRASRRCVKKLVNIGEYDNLPHDKEFGNEWVSPRDGKHWLSDKDSKWLRK